MVIDRNGKLIYSASGFNKDEIVNAIKIGYQKKKIHFPEKNRI